MPGRKQFLEVQLQPKLHNARVPSRGELTEVAGTEIVADIMELGVVEGVKGFHAEFQTAAACFAEDKAFEQREVPIVAALSSRRVVTQIAEGAQGWKRKGRRIDILDPLLFSRHGGLRISDRTGPVRTVSRVRQTIVPTGGFTASYTDIDRYAGLHGDDAGDLPAAQRRFQQPALI